MIFINGFLIGSVAILGWANVKLARVVLRQKESIDSLLKIIDQMRQSWSDYINLLNREDNR